MSRQIFCNHEIDPKAKQHVICNRCGLKLPPRIWTIQEHEAVGYPPVEVYLNGELENHCVAFNLDEGTLERLVPNPKNTKLLLESTETVKGKIEVRWLTDEQS